MRRLFACLLVTPLLASCSDSATPVASPADGLAREESPLVVASPDESLQGWTLEDSPAQEWTLEDWTLGQSPVEESVLQGAPATGALMLFGNPGAGTDYPPGAHDASFHGKDRVIPGTVVIDAGQKVTFRVYPGHRVGIYKDGVRPEDINPGTGPFILDPTNRLALQGVPVPTITFTFHNPGRYLVICAARRHFVEANMYGWVIVR
jgi:plastocyanin